MASLPHEIKRLVYDFADLETIKALRLVSHSWAAVGIELLFLPTFVVKSYAIDLQRLIDIGSIHRIAVQAAKTIRTIEFSDNQYDPLMLRRIFCSRHVQVSEYLTVDFVASQLEQASLDEVDAVIASRNLDDRLLSDRAEDFLVQAFRNVPLVKTVFFSIRNPFKQTLIKKVWEEYEYETYSPDDKPSSLNPTSILTAVHRAGLSIQNFHHERFMPHRHPVVQRDDSFRTLTGLKSLKLNILDLRTINYEAATPGMDLDRCPCLQDLLQANSSMEDFSIQFQSLTLPSMNLVQSIKSGHLKIVALNSLTVRGADLLSFLVASKFRSTFVS